MIRLHPALCLGLLLVAAAPLGSATDPRESRPPSGSMFDAEPLEPAPPSGILDQARLFDEDGAARLSGRLAEFHAEHGVRLYVVAYSVLLGQTIEERTKLLRQAWLAGESGIVVGYQRGKDQLTFSATAGPLSFMLEPEMEPLFSSAYEAAAKHGSAPARVLAALDRLLSVLPEAVERYRNSSAVTASETRAFVSWALGILVLLAALGMLGLQVARRTQADRSKSYTFPAIPVAERFGGPYTGGHQAEVQFTAPPG